MNSIHFAHPFIPQSVTEFQNFTDSTQHSWSEINENNFLIATGVSDVALMKIPRIETRKCLPSPTAVRMKAIRMGGCTVGRAQIDFIYFSIFFRNFSWVCCMLCVCTLLPICYHQTKGIFRGGNTVRKSFVFTVTIYVQVQVNRSANKKINTTSDQTARAQKKRQKNIGWK